LNFQLTKFIVEREDLTPTEKSVAHSLAFQCYENSIEAWRSLDKVARGAGLKDIRFTQRIIRRLEEKRVIEATGSKMGGRNKTTHYRFLLENPGLYTPVSTPQRVVDQPENPGLLTAKPRSIDHPKKYEEVKKKEREEDSVSLDKSDGQARSPESGNPRCCPNEFFVWLQGAHLGLRLSVKQKSDLSSAIQAASHDLPTLKLAADNILQGLDLSDSYCHAESKLTANLLDQAEAIIRNRIQRAADDQKRTEHALMLQRTAEEERNKRLAERDEELIEETLGA
jgi:hypothetical protein